MEEEVAAAGLEAALHEVGVQGDAAEVECGGRKGEVFVVSCWNCRCAAH